jgi:hypothetical protein
MRCPRQLRRIIDQSSCFNPKLCGPAELRAAALFLPELRQGYGADRLEWCFNQHQEAAVRRLADSLFPDARRVEGDSLWQIEGETLRELGWIGAMGGGPRKAQAIHKDNWHQVLPRLPAIAGGGFLEQFLWAVPDYLFQDADNSWILLLARSGSRVRDSYIAEAGFIRDVLARKGVALSQVLLLCANDGYVRSDDGPAGQGVRASDFFQLHSLNHPIKYQREPVLAAVPRLLTQAKADQGCGNPRTCPVCGPAAAALPEHNIHTLHRGGKAVELLEAQGIVDLADIGRADDKARAELKDRHFIQLNSIRQNRPHVDRQGLGQFLKSIRYPVLFLDFETTSQAIPPAPGIGPWEHVPFMFSAHCLEDRDALAAPEPGGTSFLMRPGEARAAQLRALAARLAELGAGCKTVCVYGGALESAILARLASLYPDLSCVLTGMRDSLVDMQVPFQQFHYYHPQQYGKLSLKRVLPLLTGAGHQDLVMQNGGEANLTFYFMANLDAVPADLAGRFGDEAAPGRLAELEAYCGMDTYGLVEILSALYSLAD